MSFKKFAYNITLNKQEQPNAIINKETNRSPLGNRPRNTQA